MQENEASKISPADKQRYFKIRKRTSQRILRAFAPSREVPKEMATDLRYGRVGTALTFGRAVQRDS